MKQSNVKEDKSYVAIARCILGDMGIAKTWAASD
jgi:hypothetical protein